MPNTSRPVWELVIEDADSALRPPKDATDAVALKARFIADMKARDALGRARYGTPLQTNNGRDWLRDAYEESLDLLVYIRQGQEQEPQLPELELTYDAAMDMAVTLCAMILVRERAVQ